MIGLRARIYRIPGVLCLSLAKAQSRHSAVAPAGSPPEEYAGDEPADRHYLSSDGHCSGDGHAPTCRVVKDNLRPTAIVRDGASDTELPAGWRSAHCRFVSLPNYNRERLLRKLSVNIDECRRSSRLSGDIFSRYQSTENFFRADVVLGVCYRICLRHLQGQSA